MDVMTIGHSGDGPGVVPETLAFDDRCSDDEDFAVFVAARSRRLLHAGDLLTGDRARAEDLVQQALARAYVRWGSLRDGNPEAYVRKAMLNAYLDWWRRLRWREMPEDAAGHGAYTGDLAVDVVRRDAVRQALAVLTRRERAVVVLRYWFDLSEAQIAEELDIAPGTVKSTASRALRRLRGNDHVQPFAGIETQPDLCITQGASL
jgi:RNA polymerase sigma-70 factor (sigma-E family)